MTQEPVRWNLQGSWRPFASAVLALILGFVSASTAQVANINVEIDYMVLRDSQGNILHSHEPEPDVVAAAAQMFACHNITLNVALSGRVYAMATAANGPIAPGDMLTTSSIPGHAMRVTDPDRSFGAAVGKAMSSLDEGEGLVLVLVNLH